VNVAMNMALEPSTLNPLARVPRQGARLRGSKETGSAWNAINWKQVEMVVFKLQKRIYQASQRGNVKAVRRLQRFLQGSWSAKLLATLNLQATHPSRCGCLKVQTRRVSQDNQGKRTAGVDGIAKLTPKQRLEMARAIRLRRRPRPTRRVWIPKPGREEKRPLGIPCMTDRAIQAF